MRASTLQYIWRYDCLVRVKTSVTLPRDLLARLDRLDKNRSLLLEKAARDYLSRLDKRQRDRKDLEIIDKNAESLNREALETLAYQKLP